MSDRTVYDTCLEIRDIYTWELLFRGDPNDVTHTTGNGIIIITEHDEYEYTEDQILLMHWPKK